VPLEAAVTDLPTGTLTLLFTDIQGSTRLAQELGDRWPAVLGDQKRLLRDVFARHDGVEVDNQGDAFFFVFSRVGAAASAAADAQRRLLAHPWPNGRPVRVRMGLHTGEPVLIENAYTGVDVHKAARICSAAHGGQVLLSAASRQLLGGPARDLGEFRLKDLTALERLFQLEIDGVPSSFPPPNTLTATNLPTQPMPLLGRRTELAAGVELLGSETRLVTVTGAGGSGKTHLALQLAAEVSQLFADGVYWVALAPIGDPAKVEDAISTIVGAPPERGALARFLRKRQILLLLDNFEHVLAAAPLIGELLAEAPGLRILITSRAPLHILGEHELPVLPLAEDDALQLFVEHARTARPSFEPDPAAREICRRLDCMPLALELAAARLRYLTASDLLARLDHSLDLLTGGARDLPERQRTLRATIDWSYQLLSPDEQRLFDRLAVFAGRAPLEQIEIVCAVDGLEQPDVLDGLASLADHSLVRWFVHPGEASHYFMLETVHEFALERLAERGEDTLIRRRHRDAFLDLVLRLDPINRVSAITALIPERNNLRAALEWSFAQDRESDETVRLAFSLWRYWLETGATTEGRTWLEAALASVQSTDLELGAQVLDACAFLAAEMGELARAVELSDEAVAHARSLSRRVLGWCLYRRGCIDVERGRLEDAVAPLAEAVECFRAERWPLSLAWAQTELARIALLQGRTGAARHGFQQVVQMGADVEDAFGYALALLGAALGIDGNVGLGLEYSERGLAILSEIDAWFTLAIAYLHLAPVYRAANAPDLEHEAVSWAIRACRDAGIVPRGTACLEAAARISVDSGQYATAAQLWGVADRICDDLGIVPYPLRLTLRAEFERTARRQIGDERFEYEFAAGAGITLAEAFELGLRAIGEAGESGPGNGVPRPGPGIPSPG
jgi:predicted ATPase/class 3 adenylate cyclase